MDFTLEQLRDLKAAYASGALIVKHGDKTTEFRSMLEMKRLIEAIEKSLSKPCPSPRNFLGGRAFRPRFEES